MDMRIRFFFLNVSEIRIHVLFFKTHRSLYIGRFSIRSAYKSIRLIDFERDYILIKINFKTTVLRDC